MELSVSYIVGYREIEFSDVNILFLNDTKRKVRLGHIIAATLPVASSAFYLRITTYNQVNCCISAIIIKPFVDFFQ